MKIVNSNRFLLPLQGDGGMLHLATAKDGVHEYLAFYLSLTGKIYVEEVTGGHLETIEPRERHEDVVAFLTIKGILDGSPLLPDAWKNYKAPDENESLPEGVQALIH